MFKGKYEKEIPVKENIIIASLPILAWIVFIRLGWRYGPIAFLIHAGIVAGLATLFYVLMKDTVEDMTNPSIAFYIIVGGIVALYFFSYSMAVWYLIKKHNARVIANKNSSTSPNKF